MDPDLADLTTAGNFIHATVFWAKIYFYIILYTKGYGFYPSRELTEFITAVLIF